MTFIPEARIEARAAELWRRHELTVGFDVERLLDELSLSLLWEEVDDGEEAIVLGQLIPQKRQVVLNERHVEKLEENERRLLRFTLAHEIGHFELHARHFQELAFDDDERTWCRDGSPDPVERQAEMFSAALLMPRDVLRVALPAGDWQGWQPVYRLADRFGVNVSPMRIRLEKLGWMHLDEQDTPRAGPSPGPGQSPLF